MADLLTLEPSQILSIILGGLLPALLWLWFWLREDNVNPEPRGLLVITFLLGVLAVPVVIPIQSFFHHVFGGNELHSIIAAAFAEELVKFTAVWLVALGSRQLDEPVDYPIYFITAAMGFAALENALFLVNPVTINDTTVSFLTGDLRFLGSTLLHASTAATIGISMGLAFYKPWFTRKIYFVIGILAATALHSVFNFFILLEATGSILRTYAFLWVVAIIIMLVFEKLRRMSMYGRDA